MGRNITNSFFFLIFFSSSSEVSSTVAEPVYIANGEQKLFDLYVSYAKTDADFVDHNLAPTLEHGPRATYRLCLHHRDFPQDSSIYDTVSLASESSAKILIVLSKAYLAESWCAVRL